LPQLAQSLEDIETDTAIMVEVDKEAMQKETDLHILVDVVNKEPVSQPAPIQVPFKPGA